MTEQRNNMEIYEVAFNGTIIYISTNENKIGSSEK